MDHRIIWLLISCIICEICANSIKCRFDYYELMDRNIFDKTKVYYTCFGKILGGNNNENITDLYGTNLSANDAEYLYLDDENLTFFPKNIESFFPNLEVINLSRNLITDISNAHLRPHQYLTTLLLPYNQISVVESNLFDGMLNLKIVDFSYNKLKQVGYDVKLPINGELYFLKNPCVDMKALNPGEILNLQSVFRSQCLTSGMHDLQDKVLQLETSLTILEVKIVNITTENKEKFIKLEKEIMYLRTKNVELEKNQIMLDSIIQSSLNETDFSKQNFKLFDDEIIDLRTKNFQLETMLLSLKTRLENVELSSHSPGSNMNETEIKN